ncbi:beta-ketoacyl synthase-like protein [Acetobacter aceti NBRC 14818]|uniref:Beta-ketoacyl synthase-like N-terminal domain-containing protein n=1 Tax=Acetobacter aceti NBRC 14818 TaxID=887700 RepID=A0AB33II91_ACEAC|nr:beta-ketoacyl synthase chain length factor [Acetobacter aceti]TCS31442.1 beta-ketoacyl synthase-like protein [Acetobacter aceti NBRC 14818]BCK76820.1 hypothetical protein EMQ_2426 [Acetobacter aceti NBRC 14818]GAN56923.1 hypothetical protein Abac_011_050 [Acetobacter aceti NBRC 14818]
MRLALRAVSLRGPGLPGWTGSVPVLCDPSLWTDGPVRPPPLMTLPPNERRRAGPISRLALSVAEEACAQTSLNTVTVSSVFASANGDGGVIDSILRAITTSGEDVSPTQFHNSVHNAAAGYWTISHGSISPATAIGCFDWTFGTGLLKAAAEAVTENHPILFVAYDMPIPGPIGTVRITPVSFACAFVLDPDVDAPAMAQLTLTYDASAPDATDLPEDPSLRALALGNPAARSLPLLRLLALRQAGTISAGCLNGALRIEVTPC